MYVCVLRCVAGCCSASDREWKAKRMCACVRERVVVCCSVLQCVRPRMEGKTHVCLMAVAYIQRPCHPESCHYTVCVHVYVKIVACCSVLQCVAVCCSVLQCVAVGCSVSYGGCVYPTALPPRILPLYCVCACVCESYSVLQCVDMCCSVLQCVAVCLMAVACIQQPCHPESCLLYCVCVRQYCSLLYCVAVCCSVLQSVAVCCTVCCSLLSYVAV